MASPASPHARPPVRGSRAGTFEKSKVTGGTAGMGVATTASGAIGGPSLVCGSRGVLLGGLDLLVRLHPRLLRGVQRGRRIWVDTLGLHLGRVARAADEAVAASAAAWAESRALRRGSRSRRYASLKKVASPCSVAG